MTASAIHHHPLNDGVAEGEVVRYAALQPSTPAYTPPDADPLPHSLCIIPSPSFPASFRLQHLFTSIPFPSLCVSRHSPSRTLLALLPPRSPSASSSSPPYRLLHPLSSAPPLSFQYSVICRSPTTDTLPLSPPPFPSSLPQFSILGAITLAPRAHSPSLFAGGSCEEELLSELRAGFLFLLRGGRSDLEGASLGVGFRAQGTRRGREEHGYVILKPTGMKQNFHVHLLTIAFSCHLGLSKCYGLGTLILESLERTCSRSLQFELQIGRLGHRVEKT